MSFKEALAVSSAAVVIPGGYAPDRIRRSPEALQIVKKLLMREKSLPLFAMEDGFRFQQRLQGKESHKLYCDQR